MSRHRKTAAAAGSAVLALALAACGGSDAEGSGSEQSLESMKPVTLSFNESVAPGSGMATALNEFLDTVTEKSGGKITFEKFYSSSLLAPTETLTGVSDGVGSISQVTPAFFQEKLPVTAWLARAAPALEPGFPLTTIQGPLAGSDFALGSEELTREYADNNVVILRSYTSGYGNAICTKRIETLADAKGVRIRVAGEPFASEAKAIGMEPVVIPGTEMFEALQRGVVDCVTAADGGEIYSTFGLTEVGKYLVPIQFSPTTFISFMMNKDQWDELPEAGQKIILETWADYEVKRLRETLTGFGRFLDDAEEKRIEFTDPREINVKLAAHQKAAVADLATSAPPGVADPEGVLKAYLDKLAEYLPVAQGLVKGGAAPPGIELKAAYRTAIDQVDFDGLHEAYVKMYTSHAG
ncbi:TRAP transporter substrate-binding protein DctP [Phytohabitans sp. ZYX-F-186]|uniref:TRAP transporter substrate-binding protein DctP n=1 Tax=Phytohabitans maris TaxID=3071409 RepID=A0ABU0ZC32_9ACTN|nr:TRAP transporter substrate-binding protein DctP [Phytohabitans sp. ZYX-F-186]MDQ7903890.1 TRAP transporter substrate-binding protein DctP [Phytohabitans sp. ZYX-F-186]